MKLESFPPFQDYTCYLYIDKTLNRNTVTLYSKEEKRTTVVSFARYLMSIYLKRWLDSNELVHHINGNQTDDRIENLQICSHKEHRKIHAGGRLFVKLKCPVCHKIFEIAKHKTHLGDKTRKATTCGFDCGYKLRKLNFKNKINTRETGKNQRILEEYYK